MSFKSQNTAENIEMQRNGRPRSERRAPALLRAVGEKRSRIGDSEQYKASLVLSSRESAQRLGHYILRSWGARLEQEEFVSAVDLALCEAAARFDPKRKVKFSTFLFFYLKRALIRSIQFSKGLPSISLEEVSDLSTRRARLRSEEVRAKALERSGLIDYHSPEQIAYQQEVGRQCRAALDKLSELERAIVVRVHVMGFKLARVARQLGYSRGHVSELKGRAFRKLRQDFGHLHDEIFKEAA